MYKFFCLSFFVQVLASTQSAFGTSVLQQLELVEERIAAVPLNLAYKASKNIAISGNNILYIEDFPYGSKFNRAKESLLKVKATLGVLDSFYMSTNTRPPDSIREFLLPFVNGLGIKYKDAAYEVTKLVCSGLDGLFSKVSADDFLNHDFYKELVKALEQKLLVKETFVDPLVKSYVFVSGTDLDF